MKYIKVFENFRLNESITEQEFQKIRSSIIFLKGKNINDIDVDSIGSGFDLGDLEGDTDWGYQDLVYLTKDSTEYIVAKLTLEDEKVLDVKINENDLKIALGL